MLDQEGGGGKFDEGFIGRGLIRGLAFRHVCG